MSCQWTEIVELVLQILGCELCFIKRSAGEIYLKDKFEIELKEF